MSKFLFPGVAALALAVTLAPAPAAAADVDVKAAFPKEVQQAEDFLRGLGQGNEREGRVDRATLNTDTGAVVLEVSVRSRHVTKAFGKKVVVYDWTVSGKVEYNVKTGQANGRVNLGHGIKFKAGDIADRLPIGK